MKLSESCTCGAGFTAEDDDRLAVINEMMDWRTGHKCGLRLGEVSAHGINGGQFQIGFQPDGDLTGRAK